MEWTDTHIIELIKQQGGGSGSGGSHGDLSPINISRELYEKMMIGSSAYNNTIDSGTLDYPEIILATRSEDLTYEPSVSKTNYSLMDSGIGTNVWFAWDGVGCSDNTDYVKLYIALAGGTRLVYTPTDGMQGVFGFYPTHTVWTGEQEILRSAVRKSPTTTTESAYDGGELVIEYGNPVFPSFMDFSGCTDDTGLINIHLTPMTYRLDLSDNTKTITTDEYMGSVSTTLYKVSFTFNTDPVTALPDSGQLVSFTRPVYHVPKFN